MLVKLISNRELTDLAAAFHAIDTDNSGVIEVSELRAAIQKSQFDISEQQLNDIIAAVQHDLDNNQIEYSEFMAATINP